MSRMSRIALSLALLLPATGFAQSAPPAADGERAALEAARKDLADAARRVAELSREQVAGMRRIELLRPRLGLVLGEAAQGVRIQGVTPSGGAAEAGLRSGDVLVAIDGQRIDGADAEARLADTRAKLAGLEDGQRVRVDYLRDGRTDSTEVVASTPPAREVVMLRAGEGLDRLHVDLSRLNEEVGRLSALSPCGDDGERCDFGMLTQAFRWSGLNLAAVDAQLGRYFGTERGVLVLPGKGRLDALEAGDVILAIEGEPVNTPREAMRALRRATPGETVHLRVQRDRRARDVAIIVPEGRSFDFMPAPPAPPEPPAPPAAPRGGVSGGE
ncbi:PDZ domain-containing protein [Coralloluteibacterium thermophilus]|uniref:PDZ domain-containing protein n=1 Tax=Coralloluteibacterium thermophilum TaxID=2707049 RepID=A0ABV9NJD2_9GAMM